MENTIRKYEIAIQWSDTVHKVIATNEEEAEELAVRLAERKGTRVCGAITNEIREVELLKKVEKGIDLLDSMISKEEVKQ